MNTIMCAFDMNSPRITPFEIHEWIFSTLCLDEEDIWIIQMDGIRREVFTKLVDVQKLHDVITQSDGASLICIPTVSFLL
jgi:hypothetical protein